MSTKKRDAGTGTLIPPRQGVSKYWSVQIRDANGKQVRRSRFPGTGKKVIGVLRSPDANPTLPDSWTNISAAKEMAKAWVKEVEGGTTVGNDPSQLHYSDLRKLLLDDLAKNKRKSLRVNAETGEPYLDSLTHLDPFMGYTQKDDKGVKVTRIDRNMIAKFETDRKAAFASTGTINRALAALRRMFKLAVETGMLNRVPPIKTAPEKEPRQGFLPIEDYDRLYAAFPPYVQNLLQMGFYTGMRRDEILSVTWSQVNLAENTIELFDTKNGESRKLALIDGLPEMLEQIKRANPESDENSPVFLNRDGEEVGSFEKTWQKTCIQLGIKTKLCGRETSSHFSKGYDPARGLDCCAACKAIYEWPDYNSRPVEPGEYVGFIFHDLRRSAISNLRKAGVDPITTMAISGHKDPKVFRRYNIVDTRDQVDAGKRVSDMLKQQRQAAATPASARLRAVK